MHCSGRPRHNQICEPGGETARFPEEKAKTRVPALLRGGEKRSAPIGKKGAIAPKSASRAACAAGSIEFSPEITYQAKDLS